MRILIIRASHANQFELQNYEPIAKQLNLHVVTSQHPLTDITLPIIKLWSPTDLPSFPYRRQLLNRLIGGEQWLLGLDKIVKPTDTLHTAETYTPYTHQAVQLRRQGRVGRLICTCWETIPHNNEKFLRLRQWKQEAYQSVDLFHTPTERAKKALVTEGVDPKKIKVIPYGVDLSKFYPAQNKVRNKKPLVLTVARPVAEKGYELWKKISQELSGLADFRWVHSLPYNQMPKIYRQADIFFLPSLTTPTWEEQYGMALVEAMASGLPIVATNTGAIPEVTGKAGNVVPVDISSLCIAIKDIIETHRYVEKYTELAIRLSKVNYNHELISRKLLTLYH